MIEKESGKTKETNKRPDTRSLYEKLKATTGDVGQIGFGKFLPETPGTIPESIVAISAGSDTHRRFNQDPAAVCNAHRSW